LRLDLSLYETIAKPTLFLSSPETAHAVAKWFFKRSSIWNMLQWRFCIEDERLHVRLGNLELSNPVGLAAGFDKNCEMFQALFAVGFGYLTLGTVTLNPREGNPKPRIWRYPEKSLVNSMGLPNEGAQKISVKLTGRRPQPGPIMVSISGLSIDEFVNCFREMEPVADGIELNISTPNTIGVRIFQEPSILTQLLRDINKIRQSGKPVWVKIPPYFDKKGRENVLDLVDVCAKNSIDGITAINTKLVKEPRASIGTGGLSGPLIFEDMIRIVTDIYQQTRGRIPVNACGGISSGSTAWRAFQAGASTVQLYTAFVYAGPSIVPKVNRQLLEIIEATRVNSINEIIGSGTR
jgi:dihydroorotate dehydrogenase